MSEKSQYEILMGAAHEARRRETAHANLSHRVTELTEELGRRSTELTESNRIRENLHKGMERYEFEMQKLTEANRRLTRKNANQRRKIVEQRETIVHKNDVIHELTRENSRLRNQPVHDKAEEPIPVAEWVAWAEEADDDDILPLVVAFMHMGGES